VGGRPNGTELEESDPRFRAAVCGMLWRDQPPVVTDEQSWGRGGPIIFVHAMPPAAAPEVDLVGIPSARLDETALERARNRISAIKDRW
jgi:hypothetical protein